VPPLKLSRRAGERILIGDDIIVTFIGMNGKLGVIGIEAPANITVDREEVALKRKRERNAAQAVRGKPSPPMKRPPLKR
jgi:carbon storage regulator